VNGSVPLGRTRIRFKYARPISREMTPLPRSQTSDLKIAGLPSWRFHNSFPHTTIMSSDKMFNWSDGDVILRTRGAYSRDFRVHKLILSLASPVFKDMFAIPQPSSAASGDIDIVDVADSPRALEVILHFIYPSSPPVVRDLALLSRVLVLADKYDIKTAQSRLRPSLMEFTKTEPLRVYAIACRLGFEEEMEAASSHIKLFDTLQLAELPDEFKFIPATEYHRFLHAMYRERPRTVSTAPFRGNKRRMPFSKKQEDGQ